MSLSIKRRVVESTPLNPAFHPVLDRIYRGRDIQSLSELDTQASALAHYKQLTDCEKAAGIIADAMAAQKSVVIIGDFDADGATSTSICMLALSSMGLQSLDYLVPNRFDFGYGLSPEIVDVAHEQGAELIITVDNGIACLAGVARAKALGLQVIVTDHHLPGDELPNADAIINPNRRDCQFPSKSLAGVGVAFYLMLAVRAELQARDWFSQHAIAVPNLANLLDIVAVGTVADVVTLDQNNRILVHQGLQRIRSGKCRPGIRAIVEVAQRELHMLTSSDLGFVVGPRLNAAGRLDDMSLGIECLLSSDSMQARMMAAELDSLNQQRRAIEAEMKAEAERELALLQFNEKAIPAGLVLYKDDFHQGVIGIVAGRIKEKYHRPTIAFAHQDDNVIKGSARSIPGIHIRDVLDEINTAHPALIIKFGGHAMAAGLSLEKAKLAEFEAVFAERMAVHLAQLGDNQDIVTDGELDGQDIVLSLAHTLRSAGPFGQGFETPLFDGVFDVVQQRIVGQNHLKLVLRYQGNEVDAIAFNVDTAIWPNPNVKRIQAAYQLDVNAFRGRESVQLLIEQLAAYDD